MCSKWPLLFGGFNHNACISHLVADVCDTTVHTRCQQFVCWIVLLYLQTEFITREYYGRMIYDNYVFTIPVILDICMLYGRDNRVQVLHIIDTVFQSQPKYKEDLEEAVPFIFKVRL